MDRPTYGNWIASRSPGLFGAGLLGTVVLFAGCSRRCSPCWPPGRRRPLVVAGARRGRRSPRSGTPVGSLGRPPGDVRRRRPGRATPRTARGCSPASPTRTCRLPGMLGRSELLTAQDPFTELRGDPLDRRALHDGGALLGRGAADAGPGPRRRLGGQLLRAACRRPGRRPGWSRAKAITDTAPDPGGRLPAMVTALRSPRLADAGPAGDGRDRRRPARRVQRQRHLPGDDVPRPRC